MNERDQCRPMVRRALVIGILVALAAGSFGVLLLVAGRVPASVALPVVAVYVSLSLCVGVFAFKFGRRHGPNTDPDAPYRYMSSRWFFVAAGLAPALGLAIASQTGSVGKAALPLALSAFSWGIVAAGLGNIGWIRDGGGESEVTTG